MGNTGSFEQYRLDLLDPRHGQAGGIAGQAPVYPDGSVDEGRAWAHALGGAQDAEMTLLRTAALSRFPQYMPADGLDALGQGEFALPRMPGQSDDSYRDTLENAFPVYDIGGSADAVANALKAYGIPDVLVLPVWQSPAPFLPETSDTSYSEFYVFLGPDFGVTGIAPLVLGSWTLGSAGSVLGSTMVRDQIVAVKRLILRWKAAHGYPVKVCLLFTSKDLTVPFEIHSPPTNTLAADHPFVGGEPVRLTTTGTLPGGLALGTTYWIEVDDPTGVFLLDAPDGAEVTATSTGTGTHAIVRLSPGLTTYPIGRTLGDTWPALGDAGCILGGYAI